MARGRPLKRLDVDAGPLPRFASKLRAVREAMPAPQPSFKELGDRVHRSKTSFSKACSGDELPSWEVTAAFLAACGRDADGAWWTDWKSARAEAKSLGMKVPALPEPPPFAESQTDDARTTGKDAVVLESNDTGDSNPKSVTEPTAHVVLDQDETATRTAESLNASRRRMTGKSRAALILAAATGLLCAGIIFWPRNEPASESSPTCDDIGIAHPDVDDFRVNRKAWLDAYNAAGGRAKLGCPVSVREQGLVHEWGPGLSQDLADEQNNQARLMALDVNKVIVMTGTYWTDYTKPHNRFAAGLQGYPTSDPVTCGAAQVVLLERGDFTPGAMVSTPAGRYVWLPRPVWKRYLELGGPEGTLGRPLNALDEHVEGVIEFENGSTIEMRDRQASVNHDGAKAVPATTTPARCPT